jgi:predicted dehydrogenase
MELLKTAVIGCGGHAQVHLEMIGREPRLRLVGLAELDAARRARVQEQWKVERACADYRQMLDQCAPDVVYVTTMPGQLKPIVLECLERGLHTSVEKSPGMDARETAQMARAARASKGKAIVSFNRRYLPQVLAVRRRVQERGGAVHCAATYNKPLTQAGTPAWKEVAPDPLLCDAIHHVDLLRWLAGRGMEAAIPLEVHAQVHDGERPGAHRQSALIRFDTGACGVMMSHYGVGFRIQRAEVHAEDFSAYLELTGSPPQCELYQAQDHRGAKVEETLDLEEVGGPDFDETRHFVDCILEDRQPWSTLDDAVHTMRLCEAIRRGHRGKLEASPRQ